MVQKASEKAENQVQKWLDKASSELQGKLRWMNSDENKEAFRCETDFRTIGLRCVLVANGTHVFIYSKPMLTPCLSFTVRNLEYSVGMMITASHNPAKRKGYKVYSLDGYQITDNEVDAIYAGIEKLDCFKNIKMMLFYEGVTQGLICQIDDATINVYFESVKQQCLLANERISIKFSIVYIPLNGTGLYPALYFLKEMGYQNMSIIKEQVASHNVVKAVNVLVWFKYIGERISRLESERKNVIYPWLYGNPWISQRRIHERYG